LRPVSWFFSFCLMCSSTSPDWDDFGRLGLGEYDEMAPRTRQQTRTGYQTNQDIRYDVLPTLGNEGHPEHEHVYELDYEPSEALRQGISQQGKNISYNIDVADGSSGGDEYIGVEFFQKITVWVWERKLPQCSCGHQVQAQEEQVVEACEVSLNFDDGQSSILADTCSTSTSSSTKSRKVTLSRKLNPASSAPCLTGKCLSTRQGPSSSTRQGTKPCEVFHLSK
jgi:hypothetical protein